MTAFGTKRSSQDTAEKIVAKERFLVTSEQKNFYKKLKVQELRWCKKYQDKTLGWCKK